MSGKQWRTLALTKKASQQSLIPPAWRVSNLPDSTVLDVTAFPEQCGILSEQEIAVTNSHVGDLLRKLASAEWSAVDVVTAFYKRAIIAHQLTNCLTEIFVEKALARAKELDEHLAKTGKVFGPLHGLPISLKDQISIEGIESTMGYISWIGVMPKRNSTLVDTLYDLGAVPFVKTNVPQTLMWPETYNHIFGRTSNPYNRTLTSGGSSGGEGALIALKGSPLGIGSDIGGSIRIPSALCGIYGLRPSYSRVPYEGCVNSLLGQEAILSVLGPMSNSIEGLKAFMKHLLSETGRPWERDALCLRKPWDEYAYQLRDHGKGEGKLSFGILWDDEHTVPHPPIRRALEITKKALEAEGHTVVDWKPFRHGDTSAVTRIIWTAGATEDFSSVTSITGEPLISSMEPEFCEEEFPKDGPDSPRRTRYIIDPNEPPISAFALWQAHKLKTEIRQDYLRHWNSTISQSGTGRPVDAVISPSAPSAAPPHGQNKSAEYTMVWNLLDYSVAVVPVTKVDQELDVKKERTSFYGDTDKENWEMYEPKLFANAPVSVQVVGRHMEEEAVIRMAEIVDEALKKYKEIR